MSQRKNKSNRLYKSQLYRGAQIVDYRHRLRGVLINASARFLEVNPQWGEYFFDLHFLLNRGLPIVEAHITGATANGAIDLALAWAEEWPSMNVSQRKACLQAQTVIAARLLTLVTEGMLLPRPLIHEVAQEREESWRGVGIPFAYVKSHNPPGRSDTHQYQGALLRGQKGLRLPAHRRPVATAS